MCLLKSLVIGMGLLLFVGLGALAYGIYAKLGGGGGAPAPEATGTAPLGAFGDVSIPLPPGCAIAATVPDGDRLFVQIGPAGSCARIVVIDIARGRVLGTVSVTP